MKGPNPQSIADLGVPLQAGPSAAPALDPVALLTTLLATGASPQEAVQSLCLDVPLEGSGANRNVLIAEAVQALQEDGSTGTWRKATQELVLGLFDEPATQEWALALLEHLPLVRTVQAHVLLEGQFQGQGVWFNAEPYFVQASPREIAKLHQCEWRDDYPADEVAMFMAWNDPVVGAFFDGMKDGFDCRIDPEQATLWVLQHRPSLRNLMLVEPSEVEPSEYSDEKLPIK